MRFQIFPAVLAAAVLTVTASSQAYENTDMWAKVSVGGKLCMADHEHFGESPPWVSKKGARAAAIRKWEDFTAWEYGKKWGSLKLAVGKRWACRQAGKRWICSVAARPCRRR